MNARYKALLLRALDWLTWEPVVILLCSYLPMRLFVSLYDDLLPSPRRSLGETGWTAWILISWFLMIFFSITAFISWKVLRIFAIPMLRAYRAIRSSVASPPSKQK
jgi:hypothetical protein